ncbi:response regulator transcription factor [Microbacterium sp. STN6]|uniref:response regulator transcription factor n=1 Tax=Microbacterium sp. STN6 TaxID=2995588 RepID=UPI002260D4CE|nr:response regulator transcription factor [Microbacterium sp. STN6]MCX7523167.1 response regulator transcription factor [Microbacterium sp. STN6]
MSDPIRVLVADDQAIVRDGLVTVLDLLDDVQVVGQAADGEEACRLTAELDPDVVLMDLRMPVLDGAAATERLARECPRAAVLVLTTFADDASIMGALRAGARGYLTKDAGRTEVATAVRAVASGQTTLAAGIGARLIEGLTAATSAGPTAATSAGRVARSAYRDPSPSPSPSPSSPSLRTRFPTLTEREAEVLGLVAEGLSNTEVAGRLYIGVATVKSHINAIFAKIAVRDRAQAIALVRSR